MIYFDHAATGFPKSGAVIDAVKNAMEICGNPGRGSHKAAVHAAEAVYGCREAVGALVGCPPEHVVLTPNTTFALNEAINGLIDGGMDKKNIRFAKNLKKGNETLNELLKEGDVVLFENDLPDNYN